MKILITGGLGFIGGRLGIHLSKNGHEIILGTRRYLSSPVWLPNAKIAVIDWESDESLRKACLGADLIIHTAGMNAKDCELNPVEAFNFNGLATYKLLTAAINCNVKTFFYISSAHVYSNPLQGVVDENMIPRNPHPYATSHLEGEKYVQEAKEKGLIHSTTLRLSNIYGTPTGPEVNCWMLLVNDLCRQAATFKQLRLTSSGLAQRNFITLSDVCAVISELIYISKSQTLPLVLNIGNTYSNTVHEMAISIQDRCKVVLGFSPEIILGSGDTVEVNKSLDFKSLYSYLFSNIIVNGRDTEIDELLNFCKKSFVISDAKIKLK